MSKRRVVLGASIVGVVGAAVALTALAIGPHVRSGSVANPDRDVVFASDGGPTTLAGRAQDVTVPHDTDPPHIDPPDTATVTLPDVTVQRDTDPSDTVADAAHDLTPPPETTAVPVALFAFADPATCPATGRAAVIDRENQRAWLCGDGLVANEMPITSAWIQPDPGDYSIYAKDMNSSSRFTGRYSTMTHFVAFTHGKIRGARIAFHSVPTYPDGSFVQPLESVGAPEWRGDSAGCIRVLPADAELIWSWLEVGDLVRVVS